MTIAETFKNTFGDIECVFVGARGRMDTGEVFGPQYKTYDLNIKEFEVIIRSPDVTENHQMHNARALSEQGYVFSFMSQVPATGLPNPFIPSCNHTIIKSLRG